jgi:hypothetical protein
LVSDPSALVRKTHRLDHGATGGTLVTFTDDMGDP